MRSLAFRTWGVLGALAVAACASPADEAGTRCLQYGYFYPVRFQTDDGTVIDTWSPVLTPTLWWDPTKRGGFECAGTSGPGCEWADGAYTAVVFDAAVHDACAYWAHGDDPGVLRNVSTDGDCGKEFNGALDSSAVALDLAVKDQGVLCDGTTDTSGLARIPICELRPDEPGCRSLPLCEADDGVGVLRCDLRCEGLGTKSVTCELNDARQPIVRCEEDLCRNACEKTGHPATGAKCEVIGDCTCGDAFVLAARAGNSYDLVAELSER